MCESGLPAASSRYLGKGAGAGGGSEVREAVARGAVGILRQLERKRLAERAYRLRREGNALPARRSTGSYSNEALRRRPHRDGGLPRPWRPLFVSPKSRRAFKAPIGRCEVEGAGHRPPGLQGCWSAIPISVVSQSGVKELQILGTLAIAPTIKVIPAQAPQKPGASQPQRKCPSKAVKAPRRQVTLLPRPPQDNLFKPITDQLHYLLKKADDFQGYLLMRDKMQKKQVAMAVPTLLQMCQPFFQFVESSARGSCQSSGNLLGNLPGNLLGNLPKNLTSTVRKQLLDVSQQLALRLEQLIILYATSNLVTLEDTNPLSISCFFCGKFSLSASHQISIFRYCTPNPYTSRCLPRHLYKKMRWNVEITPQPGSKNPVIQEEYYFLCYRDSSSKKGKKTSSKRTRNRKVWSLGRWVPLVPDKNEISDIYAWVLCIQPSGDYQQLLTIGFEEPSHTMATNLLVQVLTGQYMAVNFTPITLGRKRPLRQLLPVSLS
ncbi:UPF0575 protein C19orf67 homolog [Tachyglossus aculeatus]|uniref:UPF0575 protein C19orf67 homolog n=1 Tax=Tachyglossus aculeatus TaxID=9261 RepID=UPI0018F77B0C|nr:UPF0575 protein C19orf67 homolog [Tachyglossus aculeatus]